jgi:hypothetical protein
MPRGPRGEKSPADATGEIEEREELASAAAQLGRKGGKARAEKLNAEQRAEIARKAAAKRWGR